MSNPINLAECESLGFFSMDMIYAKLDSTGISIPGEFVQDLDEKAKQAGIQEVELFVPKNACSIDAKKCHPEVVIVCSDRDNGETTGEGQAGCPRQKPCAAAKKCQRTKPCNAIEPKNCRPVVIIVCDLK